MKTHMKVGELAKRMNITVRTLQYYDKEGLLTPSAESEGGFRLYSEKDMIKLLHILTMKKLGFTLTDIKKRLAGVETPEEMAQILAEHAESLRAQVQQLSDALHDVEVLKEEVLQIKTVDVQKYSEIVMNLHMENEYYWVIKHMDEEILDFMREKYQNNFDGAVALMKNMKRINEAAARLQEQGVKPESECMQKLAKEMWDITMDMADGNEQILLWFNQSVERMFKVKGAKEQEFMHRQKFMEQAMDIYVKKLYGIEEGSNGQ
ncbi:MAG: MerR family transcriptional regulator [Defluviitaleaceae bacterium]|nr:MerR family transcriptional regulator [Defluviitaleaceae bacterium]MCL2275330.1 MerR family transcriptional regulator [Defluviitaleaceae bacterium]